MKNLRKYGKAPFYTAVIHGGPGAAGEMAPLARRLASARGVLEPLQTERSVRGQIRELKTVLEAKGDLPVILIGFSWGAWLSFILAAQYPLLVKKLVLIGSGPFEAKYVEAIRETRLNRLNERDIAAVKAAVAIINDPATSNKSTAFARFGAILSKADAYDPIISESEEIDCRIDIYQPVWKEAEELRRSGKLSEWGKQIKCPVTAIHGDYDPHPAEGVHRPLSAILENFRFILLENCGHKPWIERQAKESFFEILNEELKY